MMDLNELQVLRNRETELHRVFSTPAMALDLIRDLFARIEQPPPATPAIPEGYEVADDPRTCTHALLASGEAVEATYHCDDGPAHIEVDLGSDQIYPYVVHLPRIGITLLRKSKRTHARKSRRYNLGTGGCPMNYLGYNISLDRSAGTYLITDCATGDFVARCDTLSEAALFCEWSPR